jgi:hypothetical protein
MPDPVLVADLVRLGFGYVRYHGIFELLRDGEVVFMVASASWRADPEATDENLRHAAEKWLRRRREHG